MSSIAKIRALCARVLKAHGREFEAALDELDQAITAHILATSEKEEDRGTTKPPRDRA